MCLLRLVKHDCCVEQRRLHSHTLGNIIVNQNQEKSLAVPNAAFSLDRPSTSPMNIQGKQTRAT